MIFLVSKEWGKQIQLDLCVCFPVGYEPLKGTEPNEYFYNLFNSGFSNMPTEVNMKLARSVLLKRRIRRTYPKINDGPFLVLGKDGGR